MSADAGDWVANLFGCTIARVPKSREGNGLRSFSSGTQNQLDPEPSGFRGRSSSGEPEGMKPGGVGLVLVKDPSDYFYIYLIVRDSPAHMCGRLKQGDILWSINGHDIGRKRGMPPLSGPHGSLVTLGFQRPGTEETFQVTFKRDQKAYPDQLSLPPPGFEFPSVTRIHDREEQFLPQTSTAYNWSDGSSALLAMAKKDLVPATTYERQAEHAQPSPEVTPYGSVDDLRPSRYFQGISGHAQIVSHHPVQPAYRVPSYPKYYESPTIPEESDIVAVERRIV